MTYEIKLNTKAPVARGSSTCLIAEDETGQTIHWGQDCGNSVVVYKRGFIQITVDEDAIGLKRILALRKAFDWQAKDPVPTAASEADCRAAAEVAVLAKDWVLAGKLCRTLLFDLIVADIRALMVIKFTSTDWTKFLDAVFRELRNAELQGRLDGEANAKLELRRWLEVS